MQISKIKESGTNNVLLWAISNGADIKEDPQLQSIVNDELFYLVTLENVNFLELFRLTQMYRNKVRILTEKQAEVPSRKELNELFTGELMINDESDSNKAPMSEAVEHVVQMFINLALQMQNDSDIIKTSAVRLFLPMISRKFDVQIPVSFFDLVESLNPEECSKIFGSEYPNTLSSLVDGENNGFNTKLQLGFVRGTSIIKYHKRYDQYLSISKYSPIKTCNNNKLYKFGLLGFYKFDPNSRGEVRCSLFNPNSEELGATLKQLGGIKTPLNVQFAVQLPIQYMQILENSFEASDLDVQYESSMSTIIADGMEYDDFIVQEFDEDDMSEENQQKITEYTNQIDAYKVRIAEANQIMINSLGQILQSDADFDTTAAFAMLPSLYTSKAVITLDVTKSNIYINHFDPVISSMFKEMLDMSSEIYSDIQKSKTNA